LFSYKSSAEFDPLSILSRFEFRLCSRRRAAPYMLGSSQGGGMSEYTLTGARSSGRAVIFATAGSARAARAQFNAFSALFPQRIIRAEGREIGPAELDRRARAESEAGRAAAIPLGLDPICLAPFLSAPAASGSIPGEAGDMAAACVGAERFVCFLRYELDPARLDDFGLYARAWIALVDRHGGTHHGYFMPAPAPASAAFSFPGVGRSGPDNVAIALFSFADAGAYDAWRLDVASDPDCKAAERIFRESRCFLGYERSFMRPLGPSRSEEPA
jgi:hypothetical protein